jgi:hypothetical protein
VFLVAEEFGTVYHLLTPHSKNIDKCIPQVNTGNKKTGTNGKRVTAVSGLDGAVKGYGSDSCFFS